MRTVSRKYCGVNYDDADEPCEGPACLTCNAYPELHRITCPVFVIGGKQDHVVTGRASEEIAEKLGCGIYLYDHLGHAAYEEAKDFNERIYQFLRA